MPKLMKATLEPNDDNSSAASVTLYFDGEPNETQVREVCDAGLGLPLGVDTTDPFFSFKESFVPGGLRRYQVYPTC